MEKKNNTNNPREETVLFRLFKMMVDDSSIPEDVRERIRRNLMDIIEKQSD